MFEGRVGEGGGGRGEGEIRPTVYIITNFGHPLKKPWLSTVTVQALMILPSQRGVSGHKGISSHFTGCRWKLSAYLLLSPAEVSANNPYAAGG